MFANYFYRSGVTETMRRHLQGIANECRRWLPYDGPRDYRCVLDIGSNDGTLLQMLPQAARKFGIDPSLVEDRAGGYTRLTGLFPDVLGRIAAVPSFDLITSIACFYDVDDPVAFAVAVREKLFPDGVWCVEVADVNAMWATTGYDAICHEHLCYYDIQALADVCRRAGLVITDYSYSPCNGGSIRAWVKKTGDWVPIPKRLDTDWERFADRVAENGEQLVQLLYDYRDAGKRVHLLGASTKANTVLQFALDGPNEVIEVASDRDPRKHGRRTPGTGISIVSEAESRAMKPDVYLTTLQHFRGELLAREQAFLDRGGEIVFALPVCEVVRRETAEVCL
jgi:hypothetical protein